MNRKLGAILGGVLLAGVCGYGVWHSFLPPGGPIEGPDRDRGPGLPPACTVLDPAWRQRIVPQAGASHRTLDRRLSECTLTGGGRELVVKIHEHAGAEAAGGSYRSEEEIRKRFSRAFLPPLEHPAGLGDQALIDFSYGNGTVSVTVVARKGTRVVQVRYATPGSVPVGRGADVEHYAAAKAVAQEVAAELLK